MAQKGVTNFFKITCSLLVVNLILGAIGVGKQTYKLNDEESAGSTGLIMASNEVGPLFIICFGYFLHHIWNKNGLFIYILAAISTMAFG